MNDLKEKITFTHITRLERRRISSLFSREFLHICSCCNKIQDHEGSWTSLGICPDENRSQVLSHGICPQCLEKDYPDEYELMVKEQLL